MKNWRFSHEAQPKAVTISSIPAMITPWFMTDIAPAVGDGGTVVGAATVGASIGVSILGVGTGAPPGGILHPHMSSNSGGRVKQ
jgi:hypothetical protein